MDCSDTGHSDITSTDTEEFAEFVAESRQVFTELEQLALSWGLGCGIREFSDVGLSSGNASALYLSGGSSAEFGLERPAALVSLQSIAREQPRGYWRDLLNSVVAHELAHHSVDLFERRQGRPAITIPREIMTRALTLDSEEVTAAYRRHDVPPWSGHGILFIRAAAHISHRLAAAGHWTAPHWTIPPVYSLSPASWYFSTLEGEPERLADLPITEILGRPVPVGMVALFQADVERWARSQERQQQQQQQQRTTERDNTHGRENSQTRENSEAQGPPAG
jgi:hypothetical protein